MSFQSHTQFPVILHPYAATGDYGKRTYGQPKTILGRLAGRVAGNSWGGTDSLDAQYRLWTTEKLHTYDMIEKDGEKLSITRVNPLVGRDNQAIGYVYTLTRDNQR